MRFIFGIAPTDWQIVYEEAFEGGTWQFSDEDSKRRYLAMFKYADICRRNLYAVMRERLHLLEEFAVAESKRLGIRIEDTIQEPNEHGVRQVLFITREIGQELFRSLYSSGNYYQSSTDEIEKTIFPMIIALSAMPRNDLMRTVEEFLILDGIV